MMKYKRTYNWLYTTIAAIGIIVLFVNGNSGKVATVEKDGSVKTVVFLTGDDRGHASGTHEFYAGAILLKKSLESGVYKGKVNCVVVNNWPKNLEVLKSADLIVHYYRGARFHFLNKNHQIINGLANKGVGQMFIHFGLDPNQEAEAAIKSWTGGVYKDKHSTNPFWTITAELEKHPINNGVNPYKLRDEWYLNIDFEASDQKGGNAVDTQVKGVMKGQNGDIQKVKKVVKNLGKKLTKDQLTVMWAKERTDGGRGIGVTGGHFHKNWANDDFRKQILNAIVWGVKLKVPDEGMISPKVSKEDLLKNRDVKKKGYQADSL